MTGFLFHKRKKNKNITVDLKDAEKQKMLTEIKYLKIRSTIAILTALGAVLAFIIINLPQIKSFFPKPKFKIKIQDEFIINQGKISIAKIDDNQKKIIISCSAKEATNWISLDPGSYNLSLKYQAQELWSIDFLLEKGEKEVFKVPSQFKGNIRVFVNNKTPNPFPGQKLEITVNVTGNGYLWIYELKDGLNYDILYPFQSAGKYDNEIKVKEPFTFPDKDNFVLTAGKQAGKETLLFVVTSIMSRNFADKIANRLSKHIIVKASVARKEYNWGAAKLTYNVRTP